MCLLFRSCIVICFLRFFFFVIVVCFFFFKQKTAYEMRISDWSSDVCSSDLGRESCASSIDGARWNRSCRHPNAETSLILHKEVVALRFGFGELNGIIGVGTFFPTSRSVPAFRHYLSRFVELAMKIVLAARFDPAADRKRTRLNSSQ